ncbi:MAG TPA: hypothetical protein VMP13_00205 [Acidimicrobiia bacterium]|nr:hypothetical protein [Acidimicrobiia bacterium]
MSDLSFPSPDHIHQIETIQLRPVNRLQQDSKKRARRDRIQIRNKLTVLPHPARVQLVDSDQICQIVETVITPDTGGSSLPAGSSTETLFVSNIRSTLQPTTDRNKRDVAGQQRISTPPKYRDRG